jgi:hypothetical protein
VTFNKHSHRFHTTAPNIPIQPNDAAPDHGAATLRSWPSRVKI